MFSLGICDTDSGPEWGSESKSHWVSIDGNRINLIIAGSRASREGKARRKKQVDGPMSLEFVGDAIPEEEHQRKRDGQWLWYMIYSA